MCSSDLTAWLGNELQYAAFDKLYGLSEQVRKCDDELIRKDWEYLQSSDHFYYMATKFFSDGAVHAYFNPYDTPYDAFMNYMNVLSDFEIRIRLCLPVTDEQVQIAKLEAIIRAKEEIIAGKDAEIDSLVNKKRRTSKSGRAAAVKKTQPSLKELAAKLAVSSLAKTEAVKGKSPAKKASKSGSGSPGKTTAARSRSTATVKKTSPKKK